MALEGSFFCGSASTCGNTDSSRPTSWIFLSFAKVSRCLVTVVTWLPASPASALSWAGLGSMAGASPVRPSFLLRAPTVTGAFTNFCSNKKNQCFGSLGCSQNWDRSRLNGKEEVNKSSLQCSSTFFFLSVTGLAAFLRLVVTGAPGSTFTA